MPTPSFAVAHLLRRAGFGGTAAQVASLAPLDIKEIVERVLDVGAPAALPTPPILLDAEAGHWPRRVAMVHAWLEEMRTGRAPLVEKMALFWHGHFCSSLDKVGHRPMWEQNQLFRTRGLGNYRDLCQAVAVDPAMLRYLDNDRNVKGAPNENFARESMELFTLGAGHYTQDDVMAVARAWTGHTVHEGRYLFRPERHDAGQKTIFGTTRAWTGPQVLDEILLGSKREVAARFLARKLWGFLAYPDPEPAVLDAIVRPFLDSKLELRSLLRTIFLRPEFYGTTARRALVRSPVEYVVAAMRATGTPCSVAHPEWWLDAMGQSPFSPPNVSGWRPNGYWISPSAQWAKASFAGHLRWKVNERPGVLQGTQALPVGDAVRLALRTFGVDQPAGTTVAALEAWLRAERATSRWAERPNLIMLTLLTPDVQLA